MLYMRQVFKDGAHRIFDALAFLMIHISPLAAKRR
ncbi:hypothetical protein LMG1866_02630 [Achromobacter ruhlandii]|nr:hypothetical protein LMG1866_02630 [Achromobacter ruhlandii]